MQLKEISKDIYDVSAMLDEVLGKEGTKERERNREKAWEEYNVNRTIVEFSLNFNRGANCTPVEMIVANVFK